MESSLKAKINKSLERANETLLEAETLFAKELFNGTVSRSYYAIFHSMSAILLTKNLEFSKHSAAIASFGHQLVRESLIDRKYHKIVIDAFEARQVAEYDIFKQVNRKFAQKILDEAKEFNQMANQYTHPK